MGGNIFYDGKVVSLPPLPQNCKKGVGCLFYDLMKQHGNAVAQIDGISGEKDTYRSLLQRSVRTAITMRSKLSTEDVVTVCSTNHLDVQVPIIASLFSGVKFSALDPSADLDDTVHLLEQLQPKMVFASSNAVELIEEALRLMNSKAEIVVFGDTEAHTPFREFLKESPEEKEFKPREPKSLKEVFAIFCSSGTSGLPKGICWNHFMIIGQVETYSNLGTYNDVVSLNFAVPSWISSFMFLGLSILSRGCRVVLPGFNVRHLWNCIEKYKVGFMFLSTNQIATLLAEGRPNTDTSSLKFISSGGTILSRTFIDELQKFLPGIPVSCGYGMTELGGTLSFRPDVIPEDLELMLEKPESCGRPMPGYSYKIVDPETDEVLGMNQKGELRVKTKFQMSGYYNCEASKAWDSEGYLKTGDIAYYDEHFRFFIVDRINEMFKFRSVHIIPSKLEPMLCTHPAVEHAVVFGIPHPADNNHPSAVVALKAGATASPEEIRDYLDSKVGDAQRLRGGVKIVSRIPETASGKFRRNYTRDLMLQGKI